MITVQKHSAHKLNMYAYFFQPIILPFVIFQPITLPSALNRHASRHHKAHHHRQLKNQKVEKVVCLIEEDIV